MFFLTQSINQFILFMLCYVCADSILLHIFISYFNWLLLINLVYSICLNETSNMIPSNDAVSSDREVC